ncbi:MAG: acyltransferase family protein [Pseudomonadota bacterium]
MTAIIRTDLETGNFHFGLFLYRRVRRLYPALIAVLFLTLCAGYLLFLPHRYAELATETFWSLLYVVNVYFWQNVNYFGLRAGDVPLLHMWSLAVEEQFYLLYPLMLLAVWRWARRWLLVAVCVSLMASFALGFVFTPSKPEAAFYLLPMRGWELLMGAALALAVHGRVPRGAWLFAMGPLGAFLIGASVVLYGPLTQVPGWFALLPTLGAVALIMGGYAATGLITKFLSLVPVVWIGRISYPLYLVHWPIRIFVQEHTLDFTLGWRVVGFALSFVVASGIYYLIEIPIRRGRFLTGVGSYSILVVALSAVMVFVSWEIKQSDGIPTRFTPEVVELLAYRNDTPDQFRSCESSGSQTSLDDLCRIGAQEGTRDVLVLGDSHALALSGALDIWLSEESRGGALLFRHGCMPVLESGRDRCRRATRAALTLAAEDPEVTEVILVSIWRQALPSGGRPFGGRWIAEGNVQRVFTEQLLATVESLQNAGKSVTIVEPLFAARQDVPVTLASNLAFGREWPLNTSLTDHLAEFAPVFSAFDQAQGVTRLSLIEPFCEADICRAVVDGRPLFTDNNHLAFSQSKRIAEIMAKALR